MNMRQNISSVVIPCLFWKFRILWDITNKKPKKNLNYHIDEWHTSTPYDTFRNRSTYPTACLLLDTWHRTDHCITVCGKWIFDSNFEVAFPLTQDCLNFTYLGNDTNEIGFFGVCMLLDKSLLNFFKEY